MESYGLWGKVCTTWEKRTSRLGELTMEPEAFDPTERKACVDTGVSSEAARGGSKLIVEVR